MEHILKCGSCGKYTLEKICSSCQKETLLPRPPRFSLEDKYGHYRRESKKEKLKEEGLH